MVVINMQKQLSELETKLEFVTGEIKSMKHNHHTLKKVLEEDHRIDSHSLKDVSLEFSEKTKNRPIEKSSEKSFSGRDAGSISPISLAPEENIILTTTPPMTIPISTSPDKGCHTEGGEKCIFPFYYDEERFTSCRQTWKDRKPWCATRVDENSKYIDDSTAWDWCSSTCPISK